MLDSIEALFAAFTSQEVVRTELGRLFRWLEDRDVTAIVTGERGEHDALTRYGIEEYISDCVIVLDHRLRDGWPPGGCRWSSTAGRRTRPTSTRS
jgi:circadian clock protein KaiC